MPSRVDSSSKGTSIHVDVLPFLVYVFFYVVLCTFTHHALGFDFLTGASWPGIFLSWKSCIYYTQSTACVPRGLGSGQFGFSWQQKAFKYGCSNEQIGTAYDMIY